MLEKVGKMSLHALQLKVFTLLGTLKFQIDFHAPCWPRPWEGSPIFIAKMALWR